MVFNIRGVGLLVTRVLFRDKRAFGVLSLKKKAFAEVMPGIESKGFSRASPYDTLCFLSLEAGMRIILGILC